MTYRPSSCAPPTIWRGCVTAVSLLEINVQKLCVFVGRLGIHVSRFWCSQVKVLDILSPYCETWCWLKNGWVHISRIENLIIYGFCIKQFWFLIGNDSYISILFNFDIWKHVPNIFLSQKLLFDNLVPIEKLYPSRFPLAENDPNLFKGRQQRVHVQSFGGGKVLQRCFSETEQNGTWKKNLDIKEIWEMIEKIKLLPVFLPNLLVSQVEKPSNNLKTGEQLLQGRPCVAPQWLDASGA